MWFKQEAWTLHHYITLWWLDHPHFDPVTCPQFDSQHKQFFKNHIIAFRPHRTLTLRQINFNLIYSIYSVYSIYFGLWPFACCDEPSDVTLFTDVMHLSSLSRCDRLLAIAHQYTVFTLFMLKVQQLILAWIIYV